MRTVTFGVAVSLDGFIAREDHGVDWLTWGPETAAMSRAYWQTIDTVVMGRRTWERGPRDGYPGVMNYVCSSTSPELPPVAAASKAARPARVQFHAGDAAALVRDLKDSPGRGICIMGGGILARSLFEAGLIDEVGLNIQPVLLGRGIPLFHGLSRLLPLTRIEFRELSGGCVFVRYRVGDTQKKTAGPSAHKRRRAG